MFLWKPRYLKYSLEIEQGLHLKLYICLLPTLKQADLMDYFSVSDRIKLLDQEQERFARELGEGHRLLFGVAGSDKTIVLIARARILAKQNPDWKILILCYNRLLRKILMQFLNPQDYDADITISTFHRWVKKYIMSVNNNYYKHKVYIKAKNLLEDFLSSVNEEKICKTYGDINDLYLKIMFNYESKDIIKKI